MTRTTCTHCEGQGELYCALCKGTGLVGNFTLPCPCCDEGFVPCKRCDSSGWVESEEPAEELAQMNARIAG